MTGIHRFSEICQSSLPLRPWAERRLRRLPGVNPLDLNHWIYRDDAFVRQMAYRDYLIDHELDTVFNCLSQGEEIAEELLELVCESLRSDPGYDFRGSKILRPDGVEVSRKEQHPLLVAARLVQEDFCILSKASPKAEEHELVGAVLCFPASWLLNEKIGRPLTVIHEPVHRYSDRIAKGVQRIFNNLQPEKPVYRANFLAYGDPDLHQPRSMSETRETRIKGKKWIRVEFQTLRKLPSTGGIVFGIHTIVCPEKVVPEWDEIWTD